MEASPEKPPEIVMIEYRKDWIFDSAQREAPILTDHATKHVQWNLNQPGLRTSDDCWGSAGDDDYYYGWNDKHWGSNGVGTEKGRVARGPKADVCGVEGAVDEYPYTVDVSWDGEACEGGDYRVVSDPFHIWDDSVMRDAQTLFELHTGGKKVKGRKSLFALSASATGHANLFYPEIDSDPVDYAIAPEAITLGDLGQLGSDGVLYKALGDGETHDVTPKVGASRYYTFNVNPPQRVHLELRSVLLGGNNILRDADGANYSKPHWTNGVSGPVRSHPTLYVSGNFVDTDTGFEQSGAGSFPVVIKGEVSGGATAFTLWGTNITRSGTLWSELTFADNALTPDKVDFFNPMTVKWSYGDTNKQNFVDAGTSTNQVYV